MAVRNSIPLCRLDELADPGSRGFSIRDDGHDYDIFVVRRGDTVRAFLNSCPHTGAPLDWVPDQFLSQDLRHVQCAMHAARFRIEDGVCVAGPCAGDALTRLPTAVDEGVLWLFTGRLQSLDTG